MATIEYATQEEMDDAFEVQMALKEQKQFLIQAIDRQENEVEYCQERLDEEKGALSDLRDELDDIEAQIID